jgi:uncharacterized membrane protein (Fun14 family)
MRLRRGAKATPAKTIDAPDGGSPARARRGRPLARWQKLLLAASAAIAVLGLGLMVAGWITGDEPPQPVARDGALPADPSAPPPAGFLPSQQPTTHTDRPAAAQTATGDDALDAWSPAVFRAGFGFFVGFAIAYAMRAFVKVSLVVAGLMLLALFGLQYAGIIDVNWTAMEQHYDAIAAWLGQQTESFMRFVTGYIPSSAAALGGLIVGFRRG